MKIITKSKLKLELNKTEARGIRRVYSEMLELLKGPDNWIQGDFRDHNQATGEDQFCVIGAAQEVDGKFEDLAKAFMLFNPPPGWEFKMPKLIDVEEDGIYSLEDHGKTEAINFNDSKHTGYKDVVKWLRALIKKADRIIAA